jgi:ribosome maturation factor RimP
MQPHEQEIWHLAEPVLDAAGMELILVECLKMKSSWVVRIYMDREGGVTLDDCAQISSHLGDLLDVHDVPPGAYTLEVSSPGLDRPLYRDKDYLRYRGEKVNIRVEGKIEGRRHFRGELVDYVDEDSRKVLVVRIADRVFRIPREAVVKANLEYVL